MCIRDSSNSGRPDICRQEPGGPYGCIMPSDLITISLVYTFQVAASNGYGVGPFSDPIIAHAAPNLHSMLLSFLLHDHVFT